MNSFLEIVQENNSLKKNFQKKVNIEILSNINVNLYEEYLINRLLKSEIKPIIKFIDLNNFLQKKNTRDKEGIKIIFWETFTLLSDSIFNVKYLNRNEILEVVEKIKNQIDLMLNKISNSKAVFFNQFNSDYLNADKKAYLNSKIITKNLNSHLFNLKERFKNLHLVNLNYEVFNSNYEIKNFKKTKSIYSLDFISNYASLISPLIASTLGNSKKVLILDCDNTLWNGIVGENKINISKANRNGKYFYYAQKQFKKLAKEGTIICLCSKNNAEDVNKVLKENSSELLKNKDITIKKINWENKAKNIISISKELNLDLNSFIFLDDSKFEVDLIKKYLPKVLTFQVPKKIQNYPRLIFQISSYFNKITKTKEDSNKTTQYKSYLKSLNLRKKFNNIDDYIKSLNITITNSINSKKLIPRLSQMCIKTNQFNFTTKRYTEKKIAEMTKNENYDIHAFSVKDIFGDNGVTALIIVKKINKNILIDTFLMSCRILGRGIENTILKFIIQKYKKSFKYIVSSFIKTEKNIQVKNFYVNNFFKITQKNKNKIFYKANLQNKNFEKIKTLSQVFAK